MGVEGETGVSSEQVAARRFGRRLFKVGCGVEIINRCAGTGSEVGIRYGAYGRA